MIRHNHSCNLIQPKQLPKNKSKLRYNNISLPRKSHSKSKSRLQTERRSTRAKMKHQEQQEWPQGQSLQLRNRLFDEQTRQLVVETINEDGCSLAQQQKMLKKCISQFQRALVQIKSKAKIRQPRKLKVRASSECHPLINPNLISYDSKQSAELNVLGSEAFLKIKSGRNIIRAHNPFKMQQRGASFREQADKQNSRAQENSSMYALSISEIQEERDSILTLVDK